MPEKGARGATQDSSSDSDEDFVVAKPTAAARIMKKSVAVHKVRMYVVVSWYFNCQNPHTFTMQSPPDQPVINLVASGDESASEASKVDTL